MIITKLKSPYSCIELCLLIRFGKFKATPAVRDIAKAVTFGLVYGRSSKL